MDVEPKVQAAAASGAARAPTAAAKPGERAFWTALACAVVAHVMLISGFVLSLPQRRMGEKGGRPEGVSVAMVDAADLASRNTFAEHARLPSPHSPARSAPPSPAAPPLPEAQPQKVEPHRELPRPHDPKAPELVTPDEAARQEQTRGKEAKERKQETVDWPIDLKALEQRAAAERAAKAREAEAKRAAKPQEQQTMAKASPPLQLSLPDSALMLDGQSASFSRPAGITRSGENDEFGRGVIRSLRKTMPDMGTRRGRVTVRFLLSPDGNLVEVRLVRSSGNPMLDQGVLFAVQQTSFPFPPPNAPPVDRTFLVTYIYETPDRS
jgi:TonB family protein